LIALGLMILDSAAAEARYFAAEVRSAPATSHPSFRNTILPRIANLGPHSRDTDGANREGNFGAILCVVIEE
jgi:hypothetical protein